MKVNDRYVLGEVIGSGGMSEVYAAEDTLLGREVAVKVLRPEMARDVNFRERFRREAHNSGKLNHPNIVSVFDTGETDVDGISIPYIVMERVHGRTLRDMIREDGAMPATEAAELLQPVCDALQASHEAGIIHRDIKPANIMLTNTGKVKVMDFGIARALDDSSSAMTQTSAVIGTAQYLSPEQARGKAADARSDIYALGCVMYEAISGRTPFEGETPFAVAYQHVQEDPVPPSEHITDPALTPTSRVNMDAVVLTAMAKHPADRYQSAYEMGQDLGRLARGSVTEAAKSHVTPVAAGSDAETEFVDDAYPATTTLPPQDGTGAGAALPGAGVAAGVAGAGVGNAAVPAGRAPVRSTRPDPEEDEEDRPFLKVLAGILAAVLIAVIAFFAWDYWNTGQQKKAADEAAAARLANTVIVPEVANRPRNEVVAQLEQMGLLVSINEEANPDIPRNSVIRVNPGPGSQLQKNSTVSLTVSSGKEITDVPDLRGMTPDEAAEALKKAGLELDNSIIEDNNADTPKGEIFEQNPAAGSPLAKGSKVQVTVSKGEETVRVPAMTGMSYDQAERSLIALGLRPQPQWVDSAEPEGRILSMDNENSEVPTDSVVNIRISNGMLVKVPDLVKQTEAGALRALNDAGWTGTSADFKVGPKVPTGAAVDNGRIAWASVQPGDTIRKDQEIEIRYWEFDLGALVPGGAQTGDGNNAN